jgi:hypothetical protein
MTAPPGSAGGDGGRKAFIEKTEGNVPVPVRRGTSIIVIASP